MPKGNAVAARMSRRSMRVYDMGNALDGIRQMARGKSGAKFTGLMHHIYEVQRLREAYLALRRDAAPGVDGQSWQSYGQNLEANLLELSDRLARGGYRPQPVRRVYIDKADGSKRPLGVPALEDKLVQRATVEVLNAIYEQDFIGFSYGFRPGRSAHNALDAVAVGVSSRKVSWILDADISKFFDTIEHDWLIKFIEHRVSDARVVRLIKKWLHAGVLEDGRLTQSDLGTVQGGSISPLLANIYLHYASDLWVEQWRGAPCPGRRDRGAVCRRLGCRVPVPRRRRAFLACGARTAGPVWAEAAPRQDAADRVWALHSGQPTPQGTRQTGHL